jgi:DNA polymerase-3 subunit delta
MSAKTVPTFYLFYGKDVFSRAEEVRAMKAKMGKSTEAELNIREFKAEDPDVTFNAVLNDVVTMPFLSDKRLVIASGLLAALGGKKATSKASKATLDYMLTTLPKLPEYSRLVFAEGELDFDHPILKLAQTDPHGYVKKFDTPKNMAEWITRRAASQTIEIEPRAAQLLGNLVGDDVFAADSELSKLAAYVNFARPIKESDVDAMTQDHTEAKVWTLTELIGFRQGKEALTLAHRLIDEGNEPLLLLASIYTQYRQLLMYKIFTEEHLNGDLVEAIGLRGREFLVRKLRDQSARYSVQELEKIHRLLIDTDLKLKTGGFSGDSRDAGRLALDLLIMTLAA